MDEKKIEKQIKDENNCHNKTKGGKIEVSQDKKIQNLRKYYRKLA